MNGSNVYSAVRWSALAKYAVQGTELVSSVIVARLVMPEAYGLMGMALVAIGFLSVLQNLGFAPAVIRRTSVSQGFLSTLFLANLAFSTLSVVTLLALAPLFASVYGDARVSPVMSLLGLVLLIYALGMIPGALLTRRMYFSRLAAVEIGATLIRCMIAICLAYAGWEVWALVSSSVVGAGFHTLGVWLAARWRPRLWFRWVHLREVVGFAAGVTGTRIVNYGSRSMADFLVGALLGAHALGIYSVAARFMLLPREAIGDVVMQVFYPVFSRIQQEDQTLARTIVRVCGAIALVAFPCVFGLVAVAPLLVEEILGTKWTSAIPVMYALAPVGAIYAILVPASHIYLVKGRTDIMFAWELVRALLVMGCIILSVRWGILGVAVGFAVANGLLALPNLWVPMRLVKGLSVLRLLREIFPYAVCAALMCVCVIWLRMTLKDNGFGAKETLAICVGAGIIVYAFLVCVLDLPAVSSVKKLLLAGIYAE